MGGKMIHPHAFVLPAEAAIEKALIEVFKSNEYYAQNIFAYRLRKHGGGRHSPESFIRMIKLARDEYNRTAKINKQWNVTDNHIQQIVEKLVSNAEAKSIILAAFK